MPMWKIYHPKGAFSEKDKHEIANKITEVYASFLPRFYVNVFFRPVEIEDCYIGGEASGDFVRVTINHIARSMTEPEQQLFLNACTRILDPYVAQRGYRWELHVGETPKSLWTVNGYIPPDLDSEAGQRWRQENKASAY